MGRLQKLAGQTVIYGATNIAGRFINYLLTPLLTGIFAPDAFGIISQLYSYIAIMLAVLTFGMETALFNFSRDAGSLQNKNKVFSAAQIFVTILSLTFLIFAYLFSGSIADLLEYPGRSDYVVLFSLIIALDAIAAVPQSKLREMNRPFWFSLANILGVLVHFGLVVFFLLYCKSEFEENGNEDFWVRNFYNPEMGLSYVFIANIVGSAIRLLILLPVLWQGKALPDFALLKKMLVYSSPLAIGAVCYIINEKADLIFLKYILPKSEADTEVGIYAACYKLAIFMTIFIQAFRFAAEPFFFSLEKEKDSKKTYSDVMTYFTIFCLAIFLMVTLFMDVFKHFIRREEYWAGLSVVPILLAANVFSGIYQNLSMWYKLSGQTMYGMYFSIVGALITIILNLLLIPILGFYGSAWATFICYFIMMIVSYWYGAKYYPIPYQFGKIFAYAVVAFSLYGLSVLWQPAAALGLAWSGLLFTLFLLFILYKEFSFLKNIYRQIKSKV